MLSRSFLASEPASSSSVIPPSTVNTNVHKVSSFFSEPELMKSQQSSTARIDKGFGLLALLFFVSKNKRKGGKENGNPGLDLSPQEPSAATG